MNQYFKTYKNPISVVAAMIIISGLLVYGNLQTSLFPEITFPKIKIIANAGLQPVDKMMVTVTKPLEIAIKQVPGLRMIRSTTSRGSCEISAYMNWNQDIDKAYENIESLINEDRTQLPPGVQVTVEKMNPSILQVMGYTLESNTRSPIALKMMAEYTIRPYLSQVSGVARIDIMGGKTKEYWVILDQQKMSALSVTPQMVAQALSSTDFILSDGYLSDYRRMYLTVTDATMHGKADIGNIVISNNGKRVLQLKDIASVQIREAVEYVRINANGRSAVLIGVIKQPNANLIDISTQVERKVKELGRILPPDVSLKPYYIQADFVHNSIRSVSDALWIGILLAIIVAIIFLRSFKASLTILITIPVTLALTLIVIYAVGYTFNIMTLGAIAASIGLIIDDSIVVVEQLHRTREENHDLDTGALVQKAIHYLFGGMVASSISTIVIFIPFAFMSGVAGAYFKVLANTMIITLVCSFLVSWLGLPVIYLMFSVKSRKKGEAKEQDKATKKQTWVSFFIHRPLIGVVMAAILFAVIWLIIPHLKTGFLPDMDEGTIVLDYVSPPGTSLDETDRILRQVEKIIIREPDVQSYSRRTGTQMGFYITEPNTGDYLIQLKKSRKRTTNDVIDDLRRKIEATQPALRVDFGQVISDMLGDLMSSVQPIQIKIFGDDQQVLNQLAVQIAGVCNQVPGTADVFDGIVIAGPSLDIRPRPTQLAQYNLTPSDLQFQLQTTLLGNPVGQVLEKEQMTTVRMVYPGSMARTVDEIRHASIFLPGGTLKPLTDFADVSIDSGQAEIQREDLQSMSVVTARLNNRDLGSVIKDIRARVSAQVHLPQGYHITYGGQYAQQQQSFKELLMILISAGLLVFVVFLFFSRDFLTSLSILGIAALGTSGSIVALYLTHTPLNVGSYTGMIMIVGIIGENAIFTFLQFSDSRKTKSVDESIIYAISTRLRPKLMTALGAIIALSPLALGIGVGAQLHQPLAIAVIGGFLMALPLLLILLPIVLRMVYIRREKKSLA
ncbi:MAG TPA: efflux RND transporter permease subunit [Chitinophagaceae bacterium]|nr:efflux RND transporter permease subunit [Chitinophagaceae bacterium]